MPSIYYSQIESPVGSLLVTLQQDELTNVCISQQKRTVAVQPEWIYDDKPFRSLAEQFQEYFKGERYQFDFPLRLQGTAFQELVWKELRNIPYGTTTTYGELAKRIGNPKAVRAVGMANGQNPIPIIIPCHRVIGSNGKLTGFSGGLHNKSLLLSLERNTCAQDLQVACF
jgi:methylated-DNA-[protein]-cysteine S-methyltransferase